MSRIGKLPIEIPSGVTITVDSDVITVKGSKGELTVPHLSDVTVAVDDGAGRLTGRRLHQQFAGASSVQCPGGSNVARIAFPAAKAWSGAR